MPSTAPESDLSALPDDAPDDQVVADLPDIEGWRQRVLAGVLPWGIGLGAVIAVPSVVYAWSVGLPSVLWIDAFALAWMAFLWRRSDLPYSFRAISLLGLLYGVGLYFLIVVSPIGQLYLMAFPVMTALLLGMVPAVLALSINALTLPLIGTLLPSSMPATDSPLASWLQWPVMSANFTFICAVITLSTGVLLRGLAEAVERQRVALTRWRSSEDSVRRITAQLPGMVYRVQVDADGERRFTYVSPGVRQIYGLSPDEVLADGALLARLRHPDDMAWVSAEFARQRGPGEATNLEFRIIRPDSGELRWVQISSSAVHVSARGSVRSGVIVDITDRKLAEARLHESEARWQLALEGAGDGVWDWYPQTGIEIYSRRFKEMYGFADDELPDFAEAMDQRTHPDDLEQLERDRDDHFAGRTPAYRNEHRVRCKDGSWKWVLTRGMVISRDADGRPTRVIGTHTDISERKQSETLIWQQANFDALTGLPNRRMLRDRLAYEIRKSQREAGSLALLFIDLDHFKEVNDTLGHDSGDLLLIEAARRIGLCVRQSDTVARMGGDEFTVVLPELTNTLRVEQIASEIIASLGLAFQLGDERAYVSASIGIARYPDDAVALDELLKHADQALYAAKGQGRQRFSYFTPELQASALSRVRLATDLHQALAGDQLRLVYQPIVHLVTGGVHKAEALLRWQHPERGLISPAVFIPLAESSGLIVAIGDWVFRQAADQALRWRASHEPEFQVSINKSPVQFRASGSAPQSWFEHIARIGLPGQAMVVEITEGLLLEAGQGVAEQLGALRRAGMRISLDDFGTGYSSLSYLQKFDIDFLKVDQSFVRGLMPGSKELALCKAIIGMAHELGIRVIAEGVETPGQLALLVDAGCDYGQGYLFARPMPAADLDLWLSERQTTAV